jgi:3-oxoacyl-[acyl-carrier-protein] synthase II
VVACVADCLKTMSVQGFGARFPERTFNFGIADQNMVMAAAGLASAGKTPFAISYGVDLIRTGEVDVAIVGGADAFSQTAFNGFHRLYAMAQERCRPFDKNRKGMIVGEGAGVLILESLQSAQERGAGIYSEIAGYGISCDAKHIT